MMYLQKSFTVPAAPGKISACEQCVYQREPHAKWCPVLRRLTDVAIVPRAARGFRFSTEQLAEIFPPKTVLK